MLWVSGRGRVIARGADGKAQRVANIVMDITERKKAEEHIQLLMREISHRSKNLLSVVQAIAGQTSRTSGTLEHFDAKFGQRLHGLAASHDLLVHENWRGAILSDLVAQQLAPFAEVGPRLTIDGPLIMLRAEATQPIGLALHELATNAMKYGAWSAPTGHVAVSWSFDKTHAVRLNWAERDGPRVATPRRKGFGYVMIEDMVAQAVSGEVRVEFKSTGFSWTLTIPVQNLTSSTM